MYPAAEEYAEALEDEGRSCPWAVVLDEEVEYINYLLMLRDAGRDLNDRLYDEELLTVAAMAAEREKVIAEEQEARRKKEAPRDGS